MLPCILGSRRSVTSSLVRLLMLAMVMLLACARGNPEAEARAAVVSFFTALNAEEYDEASRRLDPVDRNFLEGSRLLAHETWAELTREGTIRQIDPVTAEIHGQKATVSFTIHFSDGTVREMAKGLHKEKGRWVFDSPMLIPKPLGQGR